MPTTAVGTEAPPDEVELLPELSELEPLPELESLEPAVIVSLPGVLVVPVMLGVLCVLARVEFPVLLTITVGAPETLLAVVAVALDTPVSNAGRR